MRQPPPRPAMPWSPTGLTPPLVKLDPGVDTKATRRPPPPGTTMTHIPGGRGGTTLTTKWVTRPRRQHSRATPLTSEATEQVTTWTLATYSAPPPHLRLVSAPSPPLRTAPCTEVRPHTPPLSPLHSTPHLSLSCLLFTSLSGGLALSLETAWSFFSRV
ncbi:hypothetical protein GWK47_001564 [Chionoecetes opilio]|uniref:Uncharacterized protein n=1 Tax=Chionoecetes opilio TaxID=41210 RepID=A0A8J4Y0G2_CHIOP|nr:hypothetical protein GWK47_001564 [Chionoecetes opilio]